MKKIFKKYTIFSTSIAQKIALMLIALSCFGTIFAQSIAKGKIIDINTKSPIEFATITFKGLSSGFFNGALTNEKGEYEIKDLPADTFLLKVSFTGYEDFENKIFIDSLNKINDLKPILLKQSTMLKEVAVTGMRSQMRFELDKKVFDVASSVTAEGASASDILKDIPSVEVSTDGSISLRGSESVTIWINGKPSGLNADNQAQILEQLPADAIEKIEVITNPSSKYSPEGTAGIINIVLKESAKAGYYGSVQVGGNYNSMFGGNVSANINYSSKKVEVFGSVGFRSRARVSGGHSYRNYFNNPDNQGDSIGFLNSDNTSKGRGNNIFTRLGVTYHVTKKDHLSISGFGMYGKMFGNTNVVNLSNMSLIMPNKPDSTYRNTRQDNTMLGANATLGYKHDFGKNHYLDFNASYNIWNMNGSSNFNQENYFYLGRIDTLKTQSYQYQKSDARNQMLDFKLDYSNQITENHKVEVGYQGTFNNAQSPQTTQSGININNLAITPELCNNLLYRQYVNALYAIYGGKYKDFNYQFGVRGELTHTSILSLNYGESATNVSPIDKTYFDVFPSVFLSYNLPKDNQIQINYTRRISRPNGWRLNPFKNISDSTNIQFGNPYLLPEYSNAFELNYIKTWTNHILSFSGYFRNTDGVMQRISFLENNQMFSTFTNIAQTMSSGAEIVVKNKFFKFLNLTTTVNLYYFYLKDWKYEIPQTNTIVSGNRQSNFSWNFRIIAQAMLPKGFMLQVTGGYNSPQAIAQGMSKGRYFVDAGLRKTVKSFTFNLNVRDIFNSRNRSSFTYGSGYTLDSKNWYGGRNISLTVTYSFGNMKPDRKQMREKNQNQEQQQQGSEEENSGEMGL